MSRTRDYYRKQRKRIIKKKRRHLADCWFAKGKPAGVLQKTSSTVEFIADNEKQRPRRAPITTGIASTTGAAVMQERLTVCGARF